MSITTKDIARICGVSRTTVNRAFNNTGRINEETRQKILKTAEELNYKPDLLATGLKSGKTQSLGVVVFDVKNQYFAQMLNAVEMAARKEGYNVNISLHEKSHALEKEVLQRLEGYKVEGILLSPVSKDKAFARFVQKLNAPVVIVGNRLPAELPYVGIDEKGAAREAVQTIAGKGYEKIYFVCPPLADKEDENIYSHMQRCEGFEEGIQDAGKGVEGEIIGSWDYLEQVHHLMEKPGKKRVAFFCSGDIYALEIMKELRSMDLKSGRDYGIMGFDNIDVLDYVVPRLATIDNCVEDVAAKAVEVLFGIINGEETEKETILPYHLVEGETL